MFLFKVVAAEALSKVVVRQSTAFADGAFVAYEK